MDAHQLTQAGKLIVMVHSLPLGASNERVTDIVPMLGEDQDSNLEDHQGGTGQHRQT